MTFHTTPIAAAEFGIAYAKKWQEQVHLAIPDAEAFLYLAQLAGEVVNGETDLTFLRDQYERMKGIDANWRFRRKEK